MYLYSVYIIVDVNDKDIGSNKYKHLFLTKLMVGVFGAQLHSEFGLHFGSFRMYGSYFSSLIETVSRSYDIFFWSKTK